MNLPESQEAALAELVADVEDAWNAHDMGRFAARFAEDADFINVRGWWWRGRDEIERRHALLHETMFAESSMSLVLASIREVCPGVVLAHVRWGIVGHPRTIFRRALEHDNLVLAEVTARRSTALGRCLGGAT